MRFTRSRMRVAAALGGGVALIGLIAAVTAFAIGHYTASSASVSSVSTASPSASSAANTASTAREGGSATAARDVAKAARTAEAQALGTTPDELATALQQGQTVQQLASSKGMDQAAFQAKFTQYLEAQLDQLLQQGTLTQDQEQKALSRLGQRIPNWDRPARAR
jgi:hypothetical protein